MRYLVRQRFKYAGPGGEMVSVRNGDVVSSDTVDSWKNGDAMLRAGLLIPHDDDKGVTPNAEHSIKRAQRKRSANRKEA